MLTHSIRPARQRDIPQFLGTSIDNADCERFLVLSGGMPMLDLRNWHISHCVIILQVVYLSQILSVEMLGKREWERWYMCVSIDWTSPCCLFLILADYFSVLSIGGEQGLISIRIENWRNVRIYSKQAHLLLRTGAGKNFGTYLCSPQTISCWWTWFFWNLMVW